MENVEGLLLGNAFDYVKKIYAEFKAIGYQVRHWLLKGEQMGIPQRRHRVFFVALRNDIKFNLDDCDMSFNYELITYGEIKSEKGEEFSEAGKQGKFYKLLCEATPQDKTLCDVIVRKGGKRTAFQQFIVHDNDIFPTIRASRSCDNYRYPELTKTTAQDVINAQTFPQDYDFGTTSKAKIFYICGMSVPPIMMKRLITRLIESDVFNK